MIPGKKKYQKNENLSDKENLCYIFTMENPTLNSNDPIYKLISNFDGIKDIYNSNLKENKKFFYFNKTKIHDILYNFEEILNIDDDKEEINLSELFYFSLLLVDNPVLIKYEISINYIKKVNDLIEKSENIILKILLSKIILILIYNFKGQNYYDENQYGAGLKKMKNDYKSIIKNNLKEFKIDLNYEDYIDKRIDNIYLEIILSLIKENDFNNIEKKIKELKFESINITEIIYKGLSEELDNKKSIYWGKYMIDNLDDLRNESTINFYYILLKYIFKNSLYIYNIHFLNENRKNLLKLLKNDFLEIKKLCEEENKIEYIINNLANSKYYLNSKGKNDGEHNNYSNDFGKSIVKQRGEKIDLDKDFTGMSQTNQESQLSKNISSIYIFDEEFENRAKSILQKSKIIVDIDKLNNFQFYHGNKLDINIDSNNLYLNVNFEEYIKSKECDKDSKIIYKNYQKYLQFLKAIIDYLKHIKIKFNPRIILELKREYSDVNSKSENQKYKDIYYIKCDYIFINQIKGNEKLKFHDRNILINGINGNNSGFILLMNELSDEDYNGAKFTYKDNKTSNNNKESLVKILEEINNINK